MYIPTQEERYAKKGFVSLILCVVVPSCLYVSLLSKQLMMVRGHEWEAIMKIFLAFTYPLAALFAMTGIPFFWWSVGISLAVHAGIVIWLMANIRVGDSSLAEDGSPPVAQKGHLHRPVRGNAGFPVCENIPLSGANHGLNCPAERPECSVLRFRTAF